MDLLWSEVPPSAVDFLPETDSRRVYLRQFQKMQQEQKAKEAAARKAAEAEASAKRKSAGGDRDAAKKRKGDAKTEGAVRGALVPIFFVAAAILTFEHAHLTAYSRDPKLGRLTWSKLRCTKHKPARCERARSCRQPAATNPAPYFGCRSINKALSSSSLWYRSTYLNAGLVSRIILLFFRLNLQSLKSSGPFT